MKNSSRQLFYSLSVDFTVINTFYVYK